MPRPLPGREQCQASGRGGCKQGVSLWKRIGEQVVKALEAATKAFEAAMFTTR
jgi:hypothetical protein